MDKKTEASLTSPPDVDPDPQRIIIKGDRGSELHIIAGDEGLSFVLANGSKWDADKQTFWEVQRAIGMLIIRMNKRSESKGKNEDKKQKA